MRPNGDSGFGFAKAASSSSLSGIGESYEAKTQGKYPRGKRAVEADYHVGIGQD